MSENRIVLSDIVAEKTTCRITAQFTDEALNNLQKSNLVTLTMTLYAPYATGETIINGNNNINILDANQGVVGTGGDLTVTLTSDDNQILDSTLDLELHRMLLVWTYGGGSKTGRYEVDFNVRNLTKV